MRYGIAQQYLGIVYMRFKTKHKPNKYTAKTIDKMDETVEYNSTGGWADKFNKNAKLLEAILSKNQNNSQPTN